jgi:ERCC4-type nuclease
MALVAGDYAVRTSGHLVAAVERKTLEDFASSLSDGTLAFQMQRLSELPTAAVVVEAHYADLFRQPGGRATWLADVLARLQVRNREISVVFADSRKFADEWTFRFLMAAAGDVPGPESEH